MNKEILTNQPIKRLKSSDLEYTTNISPWKKPGRAAWLCYNLPEDLRPSRKRSKSVTSDTESQQPKKLKFR